jgi:hypothetical protein
MAIVVPIVADTSNLTRALVKSQGSLMRFGKIAAYVAGAAVLGGLAKTIDIGINEFMQHSKAVAQTNAVLKSTQSVAHVTGKQIDSLANSIMKKSGIDDEAIQSGENLLLTFTRIRNETGKGNDIFNQATIATTNLSVAMGKDMTSSALLVGKALNDPIKGIGALSRAGVQFTSGQKDTIKSLVESGNTMAAQKMILKELTTEFGGSADAAGKTLPGQLNILKETFNNLAGDLVANFMPSIARGATALLDFVNQIAAHKSLEAKIRFVIGTFAGLAWNGFQTIVDWWQNPKMQFEKSPTSGIHIKIIPSGQDQITAFVNDLSEKLNAAISKVSYKAGYNMMKRLFEGSKGSLPSFNWKTIFAFIFFPVGISDFIFQKGVLAVKRYAAGIFAYIDANKLLIAMKLVEWITAAPGAIADAGKSIGKTLLDSVSSAIPRSAPVLRNKITKTVLEAVAAARASLSGMGGDILTSLMTVKGANLRVAGGPNAAEIVTQQRDLEDRRFKIDEAAAKDAVTLAEDKTAAQLDLDQLLLDRQQTLRNRALADEQDKNKKSIDDLIATFNTSIMSAKDFKDQLTAIIGPDLGDSLGVGFATAFAAQLSGIAQTVADIANPAGASAGSDIGGAVVSSNQDRFNTDLQKWQAKQDSLKASLAKIKKDAGANVSGAEQKKIDAAQAAVTAHLGSKPKRAAYGMALGGILSSSTIIGGEAGREAVIPLTSTSATNMLRDALGYGGGSSGANYSIVVNAGLGTNPDDLGRVIIESIKKYEKTNGRVFAGPQVATNASGVTSNTQFLKSRRLG